MPHVAVLAAAYAWVIIFFDGLPVYSVRVHEIPKGRLADASAAYRQSFDALRCKLLSENKSFAKRRIDYVFRAPRNCEPAAIEAKFLEKAPAEIRGELDWEVR
jgi:hypothetical protein